VLGLLRVRVRVRMRVRVRVRRLELGCTVLGTESISFTRAP